MTLHLSLPLSARSARYPMQGAGPFAGPAPTVEKGSPALAGRVVVPFVHFEPRIVGKPLQPRPEVICES